MNNENPQILYFYKIEFKGGKISENKENIKQRNDRNIKRPRETSYLQA